MTPLRTLALHLTLAASGALAAAAAPAAPASEASVEQVLQLTRAEAMLQASWTQAEQMVRQTMQQVRQAEGAKPLTPEQQRLVDALPAKVMAMLREEMSWARYKPQLVSVYTEVFTQDEVDGLIAFYQSPAGQAMVNKMPAVMQKSVQLMQAQMQALIPRMTAMMREAAAEAGLGDTRR